MSKWGTLSLAAGLAMAAVGISFASDKKDFAEGYKNKYLVVMRDGLDLAICSREPGHRAYLRVRVTESGVDASKHGFLDNLPDDVCNARPEPVHKGEVLKSSHTAIRGKWLLIWVESLSRHSVTRGVGAFEHESHEYPAAILIFPLGDGFDQAKALTDQWLKPFDTQEEAAKFGNTASGAFVKEVKLGMTPAEVEAALGLPETKVDLGEKVLYKYKNMTVEFRDGKVADVR
jgi:hypothetical protein